MRSSPEQYWNAY